MAKLDELTFWWNDPSPDLRARVSSHVVYLHVNGHLILKAAGYSFSADCLVRDGGLVVYIWQGFSYMDIKEVLEDDTLSAINYVRPHTWHDLNTLEQTFLLDTYA